MYIKLGRTEIKYNTPENDDFLIISCIPTSSMSTDKPTMIRTVQDLRLNFGENFPEYSYLVELLESGVSLYIMGPCQEEENTNLKNYIKFTGIADGYWMNGKVDRYNFNGFDVKSLPPTAPPGIVYRVVDPNGTIVGGPTGRCSEMVYAEGWINILDLPQNTWINTSSQNNRDTLRICKEDGLFCHPKFGSEVIPGSPINPQYYKWGGDKWNPLVGIWDSPKYVFGSMEEMQTSVRAPKEGDLACIEDPVPLSNIKPREIDNEEESLAFLVETNGSESIGEGHFIVLGKTLFGNIPDSHPLRGYIDEVIPVSTISEFLLKCQTRGWTIEEGKYIIPRDLSAKITYFYEPDKDPRTGEPYWRILPSWEKSQELITKWTTPLIDFSSKTIGSEGVESWISIKAENLEERGTQRITINRYEYTEVFEGSWITGTIEEERLDYQISHNSKLVNAEWLGTENDLVVFPEGEWKLMGATGLENLGKEKTLEFIFKGELGIDFFLSYGDLPQQSLLGYALEKECQVLIQNDGVDYRENLIDKTNHLLFFYRPMTLYGVLERPAWYIWLRGLLSDIYSDTAENISYKSPAPEYDDEYVEEITDENGVIVDKIKCSELRQYRTNYLTASGQDLFYHSYSWMRDKETAFARFVLGKIRRELEKNKWNFIGPQPGGKTIPAVKRVLSRIQSNFGIIRSITIEDYDFYYKQNLIELTLETKISDLPDHDITLDLTLNYNK